MTEKKLKYQKPAMQVYVLKQRVSLLVGSVNGTRSAYGDANPEVPEGEKDTNGNWVWD